MILNHKISLQDATQLPELRYLYFVTDNNRSHIKVGVTNDMNGLVQSFNKEPDLFLGFTENSNRLVYFEEYTDPQKARKRLIDLTRWTRAQKEKLIRKINPDWVDLSIGLAHERIIGTRTLKNPIQGPGFNYN